MFGTHRQTPINVRYKFNCHYSEGFFSCALHCMTCTRQQVVHIHQHTYSAVRNTHTYMHHIGIDMRRNATQQYIGMIISNKCYINMHIRWLKEWASYRRQQRHPRQCWMWRCYRWCYFYILFCVCVCILSNNDRDIIYPFWILMYVQQCLYAEQPNAMSLVGSGISHREQELRPNDIWNLSGSNQ